MAQFRPFGNDGRNAQRPPPPVAWPYGQHIPGPQDWSVGRASTRNPPAWAPDIEHLYPFRFYLQDAIAWCFATDLDDARKGPQLELALGGVARDLIRDLPLMNKINGGLLDLGDGNGPQQVAGAAFVLHTLQARFLATDEESNIRAVADLQGFTKLPGETVDQLLTRFEIIVARARQRANLPVQPPHAAWMLLIALRLPTESWVQLLQPTRGQLPATAAEFQVFTTYLRRYGHLAEAGAYSIAQGVRQGAATMATFMMTDAAADTAQAAPYYPYAPPNAAAAPAATWTPSLQGSTGVPPSHQYPMYGPDSAQADNFNDSDTSDDDEQTYFADDRVAGQVPPDVLAAGDNAVGEYYYQKYKGFKRKWRRHVHKPPRRFSQHGPPRRRFLTYDGSENIASYFQRQGPAAFKRQAKGNPIGKDGKPLLCSICQSDQHLRRECPQNQGGNGKGGGKGGYGFATQMLQGAGSSGSQHYACGAHCSSGTITQAGPLAQFLLNTPANVENTSNAPAAMFYPVTDPATPPPQLGQHAAPVPALPSVHRVEPGELPTSQFGSSIVTESSWSVVSSMGAAASVPVPESGSEGDGDGDRTPSHQPWQRSRRGDRTLGELVGLPLTAAPAMQSMAQVLSLSHAVQHHRVTDLFDARGEHPSEGPSHVSDAFRQMREATVACGTRRDATANRGTRRRWHERRDEREMQTDVMVSTQPTATTWERLLGPNAIAEMPVGSTVSVGTSAVPNEESSSAPNASTNQWTTLLAPVAASSSSEPPPGIFSPVRPGSSVFAPLNTELATNTISFTSNPLAAMNAMQQNNTRSQESGERERGQPQQRVSYCSPGRVASPTFVAAQGVQVINESDEEAEGSDDDTICIVCLDKKITRKLVPCGHSHFCETCTAIILAGGCGDPAVCPCCRVPVVDEVEISIRVVREHIPEREVCRYMAHSFSVMLRERDAQIDRDTRLFGPWWPADDPKSKNANAVYLNRMLLQDGEVGLLPDTGAHSCLCGDQWAIKQAEQCQRFSKPVRQKLLQPPRTAQGVGSGTSTASYEVELPAVSEDVNGELYEMTYTAPCVENSPIPGLLGIDSLEKYDALIRCRTGEMWFLGPGGVDIKASPGSRQFQMRKAQSGHWLLPISKFKKNAEIHQTKIALPTAKVATPPIPAIVAQEAPCPSSS